jgi:Asp-tRNA(Asn)/Glu-tRNA(Gln) amidotransferase A subunit family amidase
VIIVSTISQNKQTMIDNLNTLNATEALAAIKSAKFSCGELAESCLSRISLRDDSVRAWEHLESAHVLAQARAVDEKDTDLALRGIPIGIKDIIDTNDLPTAHGSPIYAGHRPGKNAECIELLQAAGAIIMGKTVTTEFAYMAPGKTRNPHNIEHTPGGSSSGSAAAVADMQVPLALGTQTAGSIIRPASFCGVVGYKPSFDSFSAKGVHAFAPSLDTLGGFARCVADIVLLANVLGDSSLTVNSERPEKIALLHGPYWQNAGEETREVFNELENLLRKNGMPIERIDLGPEFMQINEAQKSIQLKECTKTLSPYYRDNRDGFSERLLEDYEYGLSIGEREMTVFYACIKKCKELIAQTFSEYQLILTPASIGSAPEGLQTTGDPVFCRMWTALGLPSISLPFPRAQRSMPIGVQLVGALKEDETLLSYASCLEQLFQN